MRAVRNQVGQTNKSLQRNASKTAAGGGIASNNNSSINNSNSNIIPRTNPTSISSFKMANSNFIHQQSFAMSTSAACCSIPPVQSNYEPKGTYQDVSGIKSYVVGDANAKNVLVVVYDIFGFWPTTLQGVDLLSTLGYKCIVPDFFRGQPWPLDKFPPSNEAQQKELGEFFNTIANPQQRLAELEKVCGDVRSQGAEKIGLIGYCWGGKIATLAGGSSLAGTAIDSVASLHPAMVDPKDAEGLKVPIAVFASKDEPAPEIQKTEEIVKSKPFADKSIVMTYNDMFHGWAAARANLSDAENKRAFEDVYNRLATFFKSTFQ